jgi:rhomboid family GlyGly-CTERM serine protease
VFPAGRMITKRIDAMSGGSDFRRSTPHDPESGAVTPNSVRSAKPRSAAIPPEQAGWLLGLLALLVVLLECGGDAIRLWCRYERAAILQGEYWRLVSGHLVHASWNHLFENLAGVGMLAALFPRDYSLRQWLLLASASLIAIDIGFVCNEPQLEWYVGLSGVLHGLLAAGTVAWWRFETKLLASILTVIFLGKMGYEQLFGSLPSASVMAVVGEAHLYGAAGGLVAALLLWWHEVRWLRRDVSL